MDLKRCDRCKKELEIGKVKCHLLRVESYDKDGNQVGCQYEEDLCTICYGKVKKLLGY